MGLATPVFERCSSVWTLFVNQAVCTGLVLEKYQFFTQYFDQFGARSYLAGNMNRMPITPEKLTTESTGIGLSQIAKWFAFPVLMVAAIAAKVLAILGVCGHGLEGQPISSKIERSR
jgi:hypothetical protein